MFFFSHQATPTMFKLGQNHYTDVIMSMMASQITSLTIVYSTIYSGADQRKYQSSASLAFVQGIHWRPVNSLHKGPVMRKMFPFDDVIMITSHLIYCSCTKFYLTFTNFLFLAGNFRAGESGSILKKLCPKEHKCLQTLMTDILRPYVPEYKGDIEKDGESILY